MIRCELCNKCVQLISGGRVYCERSKGKKILRMQSQDCPEFEPFMYYDSDSCQPEPSQPISCTILWSSGETTYLKGKNALRIARCWLYSEPDCLLVYTPGWIYLKGGPDNKIAT